MAKAIRTSETDPIRIDSVKAAPSFGRIGMTFCPGKKDPAGHFAHWDRDLKADLDAIHAWGATTVITLLEPHEIKMLKVPTLGTEVRRHHMNWVHLPVRDMGVPCGTAESDWLNYGDKIRAIVRSGFDVVFHCRGGLGRAGMMAAKTLVELGVSPDKAIEEVRRARHGAIETEDQKRVVLSAEPMPEPIPEASRAAIQDRAMGTLLGLAVGDAVGTTLEFEPRNSFEPINDMVGGGPFHLKPGQWTDDTSMALALAETILENDAFDEGDLMERFVQWWQEGRYSCTGRCFDIGNTTRTALERWLETNDPISGSTHPSTAGNGSLMRLAPVAVRYWHDHDRLCEVAARQSRTTHAAAEAVDACVAYAEILADAIAGRTRSEVLRTRASSLDDRIEKILSGSWRGKRRSRVHSSGYVVHTLEAAIWSVAQTTDFPSAVLLAANLGEDADTTAAVAGQLAGAVYGFSGIPERWRKRVAWSEFIQKLARDLSA